MFRFVSRLMLNSLAITCIASVADAQQLAPADRDQEPTPVCATPANLRSGEGKSTERTDVPAPLHQPASRRTVNSPNRAPSAISQPPTNKPVMVYPTVSSPISDQQYLIPQQPGPTVAPETMNSEIWQNFPKPTETDGCESVINDDCPEINFGEMDPCNVPCPLPQTCPTPFQRPMHGQDPCGPVQPLPAAPAHPSTCDQEEFSFPVEPGQFPILEQFPNSSNNVHPDSPSAESGRFENSDQVQIPAPEEWHDWKPTISDDTNSDLPPFMDQPEFDEPLPENESLFEDEPLPGNEQTQNREPRKYEEPLQNEEDFTFDNAAFRMFSEQQPGVSGTVKARSNADDNTSGIVIHPPMIQPYHRNQHTFVVENQGLADAKDIVIEISVPDDVRILATLPAESASTTHRAVFRFDDLQSGDRVPIHVTAISNSKTPIPFEANVTSRSVYSFDVQTRGNSGVLKNASYHRNAVSVVNQSDARLISGEDSFTDPVLVRNPYYETSTRDQKASLPANLR